MPESKSISASDRGRFCEQFALDHFQKQGFSLKGKNQKFAGVEVDLVFFKQHYLMLEVKSLRDFSEISFRVSRAQIDRLLLARNWLQEQTNQPVELCFFFVKEKDQFLVLHAEDLL